MPGGPGGFTGMDHDGAQFTYHSNVDPRATFAQFFGNSNPFGMFFGGTGGAGGGMFGMDDDMDVFSQVQGQRMGGGGGPGAGAFRSQSFNVHQSPRKERQQDPPVEHDLYVSLEDIDKGCTKKMKISRTVMQANGLPSKEEKVLSVTVKPGWKTGTKITFSAEGDRLPGKIPADVIFTIRDKPHATFKREGSDIRYTAQISLKDALCGAQLRVPTLSGATVPVDTVGEVVKPSTIKRISGRGLPYPKEPSRRGDLLIGFDIKFPDLVDEATKVALTRLL